MAMKLIDIITIQLITSVRLMILENLFKKKTLKN